MEAFSQGWMCPCEMKLLLRKRDLKRFCGIRLHFQISLLNRTVAVEGPLAGSVWDPPLPFQAQVWAHVGTSTLQLGRDPDPQRPQTPPHLQQLERVQSMGLPFWRIPSTALGPVWVKPKGSHSSVSLGR